MKEKFKLSDRKRSWKIKLALLLVGVILLVMVFGIKVGFGPDGLLPAGMVLAYIAIVALVLAFVHRWRRAWKFLVLAAASVAGFLLFALLENLSYALGQMAADASLWRHLGEFFHGFFFCVAILVCPAGLFVGVVGGLVMAAASFRKQWFAEH
ncbi:MAG: hypothetical protein ACYS18_00675 [Planctomycetota bacterium]|jgi:hypothetical protein